MKKFLIILISCLFIISCSIQRSTRVEVEPTAEVKTIKTSFYAQSLNGQKTANGEVYSSENMTAAHRTYPFGTRIHLTNPKNGKSVTVRVNDRGPFIAGRDLDISRGAAEALGIIQEGVVELEWRVIAASVRTS